MAGRSPLAFVVVALISAVAPSVASATHYYGTAGVTAGTLGTSRLTGTTARLYSAQLALTDYSKLLVDDLWMQDQNVNQNWVEAGLLIGTVCQQSDDHSLGGGICTGSSGTYMVPRFFWADQRPTGGFAAHIDVADTPSLPGYWGDNITWQGGNTWSVLVGPLSGSSTSNTMVATMMQTGTEETSQTAASACNGQSQLGYDDANGNFHSGWPGATIFHQANPPYVNLLSASDVHDWGPSGNNFCY